MAGVTTEVSKIRDRIALSTRAIHPIRDVAVNGVGARFHVDSVPELWRVREIHNERAVLEYLLNSVDRDAVVWDVGSNIGTHACMLAVASRRVVAFEPNDATRERLEENASLNEGTVSTVGVALSSESGTASWAATADASDGTHHIGDGEETVKTACGDDLLSQHPAPDVLKLDVEGHEVAALDGMTRVLSSVRSAVVEVHDSEDIDAVRSRLEDGGLKTSTLGVNRSETFVVGERQGGEE